MYIDIVLQVTLEVNPALSAAVRYFVFPHLRDLLHLLPLPF